MAPHATTKLDGGVAARQQPRLPEATRGACRASPADEAIVFRPPNDYDVPLPALRRILAALVAQKALHSDAAAR